MLALDPIRTYGYLELARGRILGWVRSLSPEQYAREFPFGPKTLGKTLTHILISEWYYVQRIAQRAVPPYDEWPIRDENPPTFAEIEATWIEQAAGTREVLTAVRDWSTEIEYQVIDEEPKIVTVSPSDIFTQLVLHEVHHRSQVMAMLRTMGVELEDIDFNMLMYKRRDLSPA